MNIGAIVSRARKAAADNTPTILTAIGVTGTIATAIMVGKASFKAAEILQDLEVGLIDQKMYGGEVDQEEFNFQNKVKKTWKLYIPAATTGAVTLTCIVTANRVSSRRAAALASAYSISQEAFREYREKILEKIGETEERAARDEITQEKVDKNPPNGWILVMDDILCRDAYSGRYFKSNLETVRKAINDINWQIHNDCYASLTDFWEKIGLSQTTDSDEVGWNMDTQFEARYSAALSEDGKPVLSIEFDTIPIRGYYKING